MEKSMTPTATDNSLPRIHAPVQLRSQIAARRVASVIEMGRDARSFCPLHGTRLRFGACPRCTPPATTFEAAA